MTQAARAQRGPIGLDLFVVVETAALLGLSVYIWRSGPLGPIPVHLNLTGAVDGWGDRNEVALIVAGLTAVLTFSHGLLISMARGHAPDSPARRGLRQARIILTMVGLFAGILFGGFVFGGARLAAGAGPGKWPIVILALMFLVVGAQLGKAAPNPFVGVRTYWSLRSRLAWDKSNRLAGRLFFWIGLSALAAAPFVPLAVETMTLVTAILVAAAVAVFESWRVWRSDPDRLHP